MGLEEAICNGSLKQEEVSLPNGLITYSRRKRARSDTVAVQVLDTPNRNRDIGWSHGEIVDGNTSHWMCNWCGLIRYGGGVTRLKKHLAGACHVKKCPNVPDAIAKSMMHNLMEKKRHRKKRSTGRSSVGGTQLVLNDDIASISIQKSNMEVQLATAGTYSRSNMNEIGSRRSKNASEQSKITCQQHETANSEVLHFIAVLIGTKEPHKTVLHTNNRIISCWQNVIESLLKLSYVERGFGIWNVLHDALTLSHSQHTRILMISDLFRDNKWLKDRSSPDCEVKFQNQKQGSISVDEEQNNAFYASIASYYSEDSNTRKCEKSLLYIMISENFALLCYLLWETFGVSKAKAYLDFSLIDLKLKNGDYERSPELLNQDVKQIWDKVHKIGQEMIAIATSLSSISSNSCQKQETCQMGLGKKNSVGADATIQSIYCGSDSSTKPDRTEASDLYKVSTCKQCGSEANVERSLICDGCEAMYHFSCISPAIDEIPARNWYCSDCSMDNKESPDQAFNDTKKGNLHNNCVVCDRLEVSESHEDLDEDASRSRIAADCGESSISNLESEQPLEQSRTAMPCLCKVCGMPEDEDKKFLFCGHDHCPYKFYHIRCLKSSQIASAQQQNKPYWYCPSCLCRSCLCDKDDEKIVLCDGCDEAYHTYCMKPPCASVPKGQWYCVPCNVARAREGMRRYEQWILQQHRKNEGSLSNEAIGSMDLLLSAAERLSSEEKLTAER